MESILHIGGDEVTPLVSVSSYETLDTDHGHHSDEEVTTRQPGSSSSNDGDLNHGRRRKPLHLSGTTFDIESLVYSTNSFIAVVWPVGLTMILAALTTVYVSTETSIQEQRSGLAAYQIYDDDDADSDETSSERLGKSIANALIIVLVLAGATFGVVLMYKFRCMKILVGYMMFSSAMLLGLMGGLVFYTALDRWQIPCDIFSFYGGLYNFAVVGVISIFYKKGIPTLFTQAYLVMTSVIMAWQLSRFEEWTGWSLLVCLALYDLCAVLTPCGPLKALVGLMQEYKEPMPGLLYEAELPTDGAQAAVSSYISATRARNREQQQRQQQQQQPEQMHCAGDAEAEAEDGNGSGSGGEDGSGGGGSGGGGVGLFDGTQRRIRKERNEKRKRSGRGIGWRRAENEHKAKIVRGNVTSDDDNDDVDEYDDDDDDDDDEEEERDSRGGGHGGHGGSSRHVRDDDDDNEEEEKSIKLGLGDFVFYSVLVSKAALYGFAPCVASFLVIIAGLGMTLVLLSIYKMALPALPISIGLGVVFYLLTRFCLQPYLEALATSPLYI